VKVDALERKKGAQLLTSDSQEAVENVGRY